MDTYLALAIFIAGLAFGSFLNVCISRMPNDVSIVAPRSYCPGCQSPIAWRDNIPVVSWVLLRGRCRACDARISFRYPAVELLTGLLFLACFASFGYNGMTLKACVLCFLVVGLIFMDAETGLLPAEFTYPGIALGLALAGLVPVDASGTRFLLSAFGGHAILSIAWLSLLDALAAVLFSAGFFFLAWAAYYLVRKRDGLGFGDIAMMAMVASFLGLKLSVLVVFLSPILATLFAIAMPVLRPRTASADVKAQPADFTSRSSILLQSVPFGVFLGIGALLALFAGEPIWRWYLGLFR